MERSSVLRRATVLDTEMVLVVLKELSGEPENLLPTPDNFRVVLGTQYCQ